MSEKEKKNKLAEDITQQAEEVKKKIRGLGPVKAVILAILAVGTVCSFVFYDYIFGDGTVFTFDYGSELTNGIMASVPRIIYCLQIITITLIITTVVLYIINRCFGKTQRSITVSRLICNLIKWVVGIALVIAVLAVWGVNTTALITGAGVLTLVVGLGLQSLIADVVAGLFIIIENEFNVGDIITVNDFRGEVVSIGIRTTKLKAVGNVKIFNNSAITGVLNQTVEPSVAKVFVDIEYGESLARVEDIIKTKLPLLNVAGAIDGVSYDGVSALGASGVQLQFTAGCYEGDIFAVQREMNRQLKVMFDENGVNIPFNQLVVHNA